MKKFFLVMMIAASCAGAQAQNASAVTYGVKAGVNLANLKFEADDEDENLDSRLGYHAGVFVNIPLGGTLSFKPELLLSAEGAKSEEDGEKSTLKLNYLNVPFLAQYNNVSGFFAETGPQLGFLLSAKAKYEYEDEEDEENIKDEFENTSISWAIGAGYKHTSGLGFGIRYNLGLSNIIKDGDDDFKVKTNVFQISLIKSIGK